MAETPFLAAACRCERPAARSARIMASVRSEVLGRPPLGLRSASRARRCATYTTIHRWTQHYAPEIERRLRWHWRRPRSTRWRVDETHVKVRGRWAYLCRALDKRGDTIDLHLSPPGTPRQPSVSWLKRCVG